MKQRIPVVLLSIGLVASAALAQTPQAPKVANAKFETAPITNGLDTAVRNAGTRGPVWVSWAVPIVDGKRFVCCWDGGLKEWKQTACKLEGKNQGWGGNSERMSSPDPVLNVLVRLNGGEIEKVRGFSASCPLDAGGLRFVWLGNAKPEESVDLLARTVKKSSRSLTDEALSTLAYHRNVRADEVLEAMASAPNAAKAREDALFWLGQTRGERGARFLTKVVNGDPDGEIRKKAIFSLSQSGSSGAADTLIRVSREDRNAEVRGEALFWLAQMDDPKSPDAILQAIRQDPEIAVRKKGVFALTQLDGGRGVSLLLQVGRETKDREVRKEALFWLAQSDDPAALKHLDKVLNE